MKKEVEIKHLPMEEKKRLVAEGKMHWFFPGHIVEQIIICIVVFLVLITLATMFPPALDEMADPFTTPDHIQPEWYFLAAYQELKIAEKLMFIGAWAPKVIGIGMQGVIVGFLFAIPFLDPNPDRQYSKRKIALALGGAAVLGFIGLTIWGHFS